MTEAAGAAPGGPARRWARLLPGNGRSYPVNYQDQWLRVVDRPNPDIPLIPGHLWLEMKGKSCLVQADHFEVVERSRPMILVVDDDPSIRRTLQIALSKAGYEVLQAQDGEEAVRLWRERGPDLLIADIHMPRKSGLLLMEELQASKSAARIIAMTDGGPARQFNLLGLAELLGAVKTIAKPFTLDAMVTLVAQELTSG